MPRLNGSVEAAVEQVVVTVGLALNRRICSHRQCDDNVDFVRLLVFADPPAARRPNCQRAQDRKPYVGSWIDSKGLPLNQLEKILANAG